MPVDVYLLYCAERSQQQDVRIDQYLKTGSH